MREEIKSLRHLWKKGQPFFMQMEVVAPYDGCFREPNLYLVTPPGCEMQAELAGEVPSRFPPEKERVVAELHKARQQLTAAEHAVDRPFWYRTMGGYLHPLKELPRAVAAWDAYVAAEEAMWEAEEAWEGVRDLPALTQPNLVVWPLYASGQGAGMDACHSLKELLQVCEDESVSDLACRSTWPEGLEGSRLAEGSCYGTIRFVGVSPLYVRGKMVPINDAVYAGERYWMHALRVAQEQWNINLLWRCAKCEGEIEYSECEGAPEMTGYHGDGGIGIHPTGVMCDECISEGTCRSCQDGGGAAYETYDEDVAACGWDLCGYCLESIMGKFEGELIWRGEEDMDLPQTVKLGWHKDTSQLELPGMEAAPVWRFMASNDDTLLPIEICDVDGLLAVMQDSSEVWECLNPEWSGDRGLYLPGGTLEKYVSEPDEDEEENAA